MRTRLDCVLWFVLMVEGGVIADHTGRGPGTLVAQRRPAAGADGSES